MLIRLLGPVDVVGDAGVVPLGGAKERVLLSLLALNVGEAVSTPRLMDALWGDRPPRTASGTLRSYVSRLRSALAPGGFTVASVPGGVRLEVPQGGVDVQVVEALVRESSDAASAERRAELLASALACWRGPALGDLATHEFAQADAARLEEHRMSTLEQRVSADLAVGRHQALVAELEAVCEAAPYREGLWGARMLALYRCARQADALRAYGQLRRRLVEDLGIEPSAPLRELEAAILAQSPTLEWAPAATTGATSGLRRLPLTADAPFAGRREPKALLLAAWEEAVGGCPALALVAGEPGIGKSRLAIEVARHAEATGGLAVYGRADEQVKRPFGPIVEALERLLAALPPADRAMVGDRWSSTLGALAPALRRGLQSEAPAPELGEREKLFEDVLAMLCEVSARRPLLVVLDDLHWAGSETIELLHHVVGSTADLRALAIATYRDTEVGDDHPLSSLRLRPEVTSIPLAGLDADAVGLIVGDEALGRRVHGATAGNPFLSLELARHLGDPANEGTIPSTAREVLTRRARRLGEPATSVLRLAAVIGREFPCRLIEEVVGSDDGHVLDALDGAVHARLVQDLGDGRFSFSHDLVRNALLAELTSARRARLHHRLADVLAAVPIQEQDPVALARHAAAAVADGFPVALAVDAALRAVRRSLEQLAPERAAAVLDRALEVVDGRPQPDPSLRCELILARADVLEFMGQRNGLRELALEAADDARAAGSAEQLARCARRHYGWGEVGEHDPTTIALTEEALDALPDDAFRWRSVLLAVLAQVYGNGQGRAAESIVLAEEALELARRSRDTHALLFCLAAVDRCRLGHPDVHRRVEVNDELVEVASRSGAHAMRFAGLRQQAAARLDLGDIDGFRAERRAMERVHLRLGSWISSFWVRAYRITGQLVVGHFEAAAAELEALGSDLADETNAVTMWAGMQAMLQREQGRMLDFVPTLDGAAAMFPTLTIFRAGAAAYLAEGGELAAAKVRYDALLADDAAAVPRDQTLAACAAGLTEVCVRLHDAAGAAVLRRLLSPYAGLLVTTGGNTFCFGTADRFIGMLRLVEGDHDAALAHLDAALTLEEAMGAEPFAARTRRWLAEALLARAIGEDRPRALDELHLARAVASRLGMAALEAEVQAVLDAAATTAGELEQIG